jgi:t-SNARE complex subunit (syntaxin)
MVTTEGRMTGSEWAGRRVSDLGDDPAFDVLLTYHRQARQRVEQMEPARLTRSTRIIIWGLRVYVVLMVVVVVLNAVLTARG